jgi:hypothetical protein
MVIWFILSRFGMRVCKKNLATLIKSEITFWHRGCEGFCQSQTEAICGEKISIDQNLAYD